MSVIICTECAKENEPHETVCVRCFSVLTPPKEVIIAPLLPQNTELAKLQQQLERLNDNFDFLEALFEEISTLSGINFIADLELFILPLKFFQQSDNLPRTYSNKFAQSYSAIHWEMTSVYRLAISKELMITERYKNAAGNIIDSNSIKALMPANKTHHSINNSYLHDWQTGRYSVELLVGNTKIAQGDFEIY
jgi:hypothetical protein